MACVSTPGTTPGQPSTSYRVQAQNAAFIRTGETRYESLPLRRDMNISEKFTAIDISAREQGNRRTLAHQRGQSTHFRALSFFMTFATRSALTAISLPAVTLTDFPVAVTQALDERKKNCFHLRRSCERRLACAKTGWLFKAGARAKLRIPISSSFVPGHMQQ
ncbi:hypothetical protein V5799_032050 [Amblyomma americanum]|uniref:Uncharacterized protein n=1 Tax=Amblyomma americanum TaxID=6943 RepID=A0AAQ4DSA1_AMBAM